MQQPLWKRLASYIQPVHLETTESDYNDLLKVVLKKGRYQLLTANAIYSYGDLYDNFSKAFKRIDIAKRPIENVLIIGFGLGSIPYMLEKTFHRKYYYTAVEIDEEVLYLANKYVVPDLTSNLNFVVSDARSFVNICEDEFDLICMDAFHDDKVPEELEETGFLEDLKSLLTPNGILVFNKLAFHLPDKQEALRFFKNRFLTTFPNGVYIDVDGNYMLINDRKFLL